MIRRISIAALAAVAAALVAVPAAAQAPGPGSEFFEGECAGAQANTDVPVLSGTENGLGVAAGDWFWGQVTLSASFAVDDVAPTDAYLWSPTLGTFLELTATPGGQSSVTEWLSLPPGTDYEVYQDATPGTSGGAADNVCFSASGWASVDEPPAGGWSSATVTGGTDASYTGPTQADAGTAEVAVIVLLLVVVGLQTAGLVRSLVHG